jgi:hypothetical protein
MSSENESAMHFTLRNAEITPQDVDLLDVLSDANTYAEMVYDSFLGGGISLVPQDILIYRAPNDMDGNERALTVSLALSLNRRNVTVRELVKSPEDQPNRRVGEISFLIGQTLDFFDPESLRNSVGAITYQKAVMLRGDYMLNGPLEKQMYGWKHGKKLIAGYTNGANPVSEAERVIRGLCVSQPWKFFHYRSGEVISLTS